MMHFFTKIYYYKKNEDNNLGIFGGEKLSSDYI